jgi:hypothetical protein
MKKLGLIALFLLCLQFGSAQSLLQLPVTLKIDNASLEQALYLLSEQEQVRFSFTNELLPPGNVSIDVMDLSLEETLRTLLASTPLSFRELGAQIVIYLPEDKTFTLNGVLRDSVSGEPLINANVLEQNSGRGTTTNAYGYYSITLPAGPVVLSYSYVGYKMYDIDFYLQKNQRIDLAMHADLTLQQIEVISDKILAGMQLSSVDGSSTLGVGEVERLPALAGEPDLIRSMYLLPGVQTGADGIGGIHVRGGGNGQNLIMLDGVPVYNINHAAGLFSVFNSNAIRSAKLYRGGFPARYGGRLSSVLDIRTKEGNRHNLRAEGDIGLLSTRLTVEGPIVKDKSSFIVSGRRSLLGLYLQPLAEEFGGEGQYDYDFYDVNAKLNTELSPLDNLYFSYYQGQDDYSQSGESVDTLQRTESGMPGSSRLLSQKYFEHNLSWRTQSAVLRWTHLFGDKLFGSMAATFSGLNTDISYQERDSLQDLSPGGEAISLFSVGRYQSKIQDLGLKVDFDYWPSTSYHLKFGAQAVRHNFEPGLLSIQVESVPDDLPDEDPTEGNNEHLAWAYAAYAENLLKWSDELEVNAGLHLAVFQVDGQTYFLPQPRLLVNWRWRPTWQTRGYVSKMAQFAHLLYNTATGLPTEMWVPSTASVRPQEAWQTGVATTWSGIKGWSFTAELYGKRMDHLLSYLEGATQLNDWQSSVTSGRGTAYGLELIAEKQLGATRGWTSYTLSRATRQFDAINRGEAYPFRYDRRHNFNAAILHRFNDHVEFSASYTYSTGLAITLPNGQYTITLPGRGEVVVIEYGARNAFRLPAYHRLDVGLNLSFDGKHLRHFLNLGIYNVYNRRNILYVRTAFDAQGQLRRYQPTAFLPLLPSINYAAKF